MSKIEKIDPNFSVQTSLDRPDIRFCSADSEVFQLCGIFREDGRYRRMPASVASRVSEGVNELHTHTAGGRLRFCTTSSCVAICAKMSPIGKMPHFALTGSAGFDLYERIDGQQIYLGTFVPPFDISDGFDSILELGSARMRELTIHFPLYSGVEQLYIGLEHDAELTQAPAYAYPKPVVYYGSSITQGGCASRPANAYSNRLSLMLDCDHVNLGFSGCAKAEDVITEYISGLDMSILVYDYDYNAPDPEYLERTHEKMFRRIRAAQPDLPIIMMSLPKIPPHSAGIQQQRLDIIRGTYENALAAGDRNVYLVTGAELMGESVEAATVDNCHPNDLGFYFMAEKLAPIIRSILSGH